MADEPSADNIFQVDYVDNKVVISINTDLKQTLHVLQFYLINFSNHSIKIKKINPSTPHSF